MKKGYSHIIKPLFLLIDICIINAVVFFISDKEYLNLHFLTYSSIFWVISTLITRFYNVYRFTKILRVCSLLLTQFSLFFLGYFTYFSLFKEGEIINNQTYIFITIISCITLFKFLSFFILKKYRSKGNNYRNVVFLENDDTSKQMITLFKNKLDLGYKYIGFFSDKESLDTQYLGALKNSFSYILENNIDEIYCTVSKLKKNQIKKITKFANQNNRVVKLIPNSNELYSKNQSVEYYNDTIMVLNVKKLPFEFIENFYVKRIFDIVFSLLVCVFILSWLIPILWVLVKLESKGPLVFKQQREGLNGSKFICYKFRSMRINKLSDKVHTTKNDDRITKIGAFLRKTSMDELPQFFNVLLGDMSVVGPRPHMNTQSLKFEREIEKYIDRHTVKPGITGLAQVSGYRGEILKKSDIENRVRLDIFYIENWSFFLDIKIILKTILNVFKGEEKAY